LSLDVVKAFDRVSKAFKIWYGINLETREHALRGWNWGKTEFGKAELAFNVQNRPAFEVPYSEISNTNLAGKNEVAVEFALPTDGATNGANGHPQGSTKNRGRKAGAGRDQLVEMRFYIPGTAVKKDKGDDGEDMSVEGEDAEEQNAANLFYETLLEKAEIGEVAGDTFATFLDVLHLTPRWEHHALLSIGFLTYSTPGADSTLICTRIPSGYGARHTTTRSSTSQSRSSSYCQRTMTLIP
jgi:structure-specific recognition protein 1